jgi:hypothetical protein
MTEHELRLLVRQAIVRHAGSGGLAASNVRPARSPLVPSHDDAQAGFAMFIVPSGADADGPCVIEPAVACNHCGYCQSLGH